MRKINAIDLFSGAGGLSEGFYETNKYNFICHVEWEKPMIETLRNNLVRRWGYSETKAKKSVIQFDIQRTDELLNGKWCEETKKLYSKFNDKEFIEKGMDGIIKNKTIDVIIGGPPCQAYSLAGRAQDPHSMKDDYRNYLFESFVKVVDHYKPYIFVFENVPGILSAKPGDKFVIERIFEAFSAIGYSIREPNIMAKSIYSSADFGVPQERHRVIIFGVRNDSNIQLETLYETLNKYKSKEAKKTVRDAIENLPKFEPLEVPIKIGRNNFSHKLIGNIQIPLHEARYHNQRDISVFHMWLENNMNNIPNDDKLKFYQSVTGKTTNHNKYRSLEWDKPSPTIVSHLYKDGLMFIHPDINQLRSITMREAALLQTFPIDFDFIGSSAYVFKMIGNAVPVLFAKQIGFAVSDVIKGVLKNEKKELKI